MAPQPSWRSLTSRTPEHTPASGSSRLTTGLLIGCVQRLAFPDVNRATIDVLAAEGCTVEAPAASKEVPVVVEELPSVAAQAVEEIPDATPTAVQEEIHA